MYVTSAVTPSSAATWMTMGCTKGLGYPRIVACWQMMCVNHCHLGLYVATTADLWYDGGISCAVVMRSHVLPSSFILAAATAAPSGGSCHESRASMMRESDVTACVHRGGTGSTGVTRKSRSSHEYGFRWRDAYTHRATGRNARATKTKNERSSLVC